MAIEITHSEIPADMNWLDYVEQEHPGFKDAYLETLRWRGLRYELVTFPKGTQIKPNVRKHE